MFDCVCFVLYHKASSIFLSLLESTKLNLNGTVRLLLAWCAKLRYTGIAVCYLR